MLSTIATLMLVAIRIPGLESDDLPFRAAQTATTVAFITVPLGILLMLLARVFWNGRYLGLVAGYKEYGVAKPREMGHFVGSLIGALGIFQLVFPFLVRLWGPGAFIAFIFLVVGIGVTILIGGAHYEKG